jgi:hypothetical protein
MRLIQKMASLLEAAYVILDNIETLAKMDIMTLD